MDPVPGELDARTIENLRCRDVAALETAYRLHAGPLLRLARSLLADPCEAEDAVQEIFLKVFERAHQFDGMARFSTWLHRLAVNHCLNRLEHERRRRTDALPEVDDRAPVDLAPRRSRPPTGTSRARASSACSRGSPTSNAPSSRCARSRASPTRRSPRSSASPSGPSCRASRERGRSSSSSSVDRPNPR